MPLLSTFSCYDISVLLWKMEETSQHLMAMLPEEEDISEWQPLSYKNIMDTLVSTKSTAKLKPESKLLINNYIDILRRDIMKDGNDKLDLPNSMIDALLLYIAYMAHSTITSFDASKRGGMTESDLLYQKFLAACNELDMQGYKIPLNTETLSIRAKGYV